MNVVNYEASVCIIYFIYSVAGLSKKKKKYKIKTLTKKRKRKEGETRRRNTKNINTMKKCKQRDLKKKIKHEQLAQIKRERRRN